MPAPLRRDVDGDFLVELDPSARDLLEHMCTELEALLVTDSPLLVRLFPPPYGDDDERNQGFAALAVPELMEHRLEGLATLRRTVRAERVTEDELMVWMRAVNDMRLVLGTMLEVDDDSRSEIPEGMEDTMAVYEFLGYLLEMTVQALAQ